MTDPVDYNYDLNQHTPDGARAALAALFPDAKPSSLLDVGCGRGTWIKAALDAGVADVFGVDGSDIPPGQLRFPTDRFRRQNLAEEWSLGRKFEVVLCLEVAEHIDAARAGLFVRNLAAHGDTIFFSAACPGQGGQHHVNCQWPVYWQQLFNATGFVCDDAARWRIWEMAGIESWYRQNLFVARRDPSHAGSEPRIRAVVHPEMLRYISTDEQDAEWRKLAEAGRMPGAWYAAAMWKAYGAKLRRRFQKPN